MTELGFFENERVELIRGVIVRMPPQGPLHSSPIEKLTSFLVPALLGRAKVRCQMPLVGPPDSVPEPDLAVVAQGDYRAKHPSTAHLVIEVSHTSRGYDRETKAPLYAEMGVPELWLVDVARQTIEVRTDPEDGLYRHVETFGLAQSIAPRAFPDVSVSVAAIFEP
ncbi:MAG: Uma2 family endonuclease [Deltaproteobacteria bacterium]|nr:Uma2 family endonuclease [Deltaproteobacteria bacterium]